MTVPREVRDGAVAAFSARRPGAEVLGLSYDSYVDDARSAAPDDHRILVFDGEDREVRVEVVYEPAVTDLTVHVTPPVRIEVQILTLQPKHRLCVSGMPPVTLSTTRRGPVSVAVAPGNGQDAPVPWQTSWIPL